jgi:hypothetical protein
MGKKKDSKDQKLKLKPGLTLVPPENVFPAEEFERRRIERELESARKKQLRTNPETGEPL